MSFEGNFDCLAWLQKWYIENCDGDWEHSYGISISTIDNPGWSVKIDIHDYNIDDTSVNLTGYPEPGDTWLTYRVEKGCFYGHSDPTQLCQIILVFKQLIEQQASSQ